MYNATLLSFKMHLISENGLLQLVFIEMHELLNYIITVDTVT